MEQITIERMKRTQIILLLAAFLLFLGGCGKEDGDSVKNLSDMAVPMSGGVDIEHFGSEEWTGGNVEPEGEKIFAEPMEISHEEAAFVLEQDFIKSCVSIGAGGIYLTGFYGKPADGEPDRKNYFLGRIEEEEMSIQEFDLKVPEDLFGMRGCVDADGNWHLLLVERIDGKMTYGKAEIWVIDRQGQKLETIDCAEMMQTKPFIPFWMAVDEEGNYFFANNGTLLWVDSEGAVKKWYETDSLYGLGIGRSGEVYGVFETADGEAYLGCLNPEEGVVDKLTDIAQELYSSFEVLQPGVNSELLLANKGNGIWKYDGEQLELVCSVKEILGNGQDIAGMGFPGDGRACVMSYQQEKHRVDFKPIEK